MRRVRQYRLDHRRQAPAGKQQLRRPRAQVPARDANGNVEVTYIPASTVVPQSGDLTVVNACMAHYDPNTGRYGFVAMRAVRLGGAVTVVALVGFMVISIRREHRTAGH